LGTSSQIPGGNQRRLPMLELFNKLNTVEDLESFIKGTSADTNAESRENTNIEYKEAHQKFININEIGKDVSGFANSEGGIIFYGIKCERDDKTKPKEISGLDRTNIETLDRVINSHVHYPINGIQKKLIPNDDPQVMLLYVPQSDASPHQNSNGKYYFRSGSETRPMPHYLVELHFGKRRRPKLSIKLERIEKPQLPSFKDGWSPAINIYPRILNSGKAIAKYVRALFLFPSDAYFKPEKNPYRVYASTIRDISNSNFYPGKKVWEFKDNQGVIHTTEEQRFGPFAIEFNKVLLLEPDTEENNPIFEWEIYAEEMEPQKGKVILSSLFS